MTKAVVNQVYPRIALLVIQGVSSGANKRVK